MIELSQLAEYIQTKLNSKGDLYNFYVATDTSKFKSPSRNKNDITEYVNCLLTLNGSDVSTVQTGSLISTATCTLRLIMRLKGFDEDVMSTPENGVSEIISYGDISRVKLLRKYLDSLFRGNELIENVEDGENPSITYTASAVYDFAQSGIRSQVERLGDSYTFSATIYYTFVQNGINTRATVFNLDGALIPYQSVTVFRTPTMDGNVYANTKDGATKNLTSQTTFSVSFELPALKEDATTNNMLNFLLDGEPNEGHFLKVNIGGKEKEYLVTYGEVKEMGETIKNLGQTLTLLELPDDYDLISFPDSFYIYQVTSQTAFSINSSPYNPVYLFGENGGFLSVSRLAKVGDYVVSAKPLNKSWLTQVN